MSNELKNIIELNIKSNDNTMINIKEQFFLDNIELTEKTTIEDFSKNHDKLFFTNLLELHNNIVNSQKVLQISLNNICSIINIDKNIYLQKKEELELQINTVNVKLNKVRTKQFKS